MFDSDCQLYGVVVILLFSVIEVVVVVRLSVHVHFNLDLSPRDS